MTMPQFRCCYFICFFTLDKFSHCLNCLGTYIPGWSGIHRNLPPSASWVMVLVVYVTRSCPYFSQLIFMRDILRPLFLEYRFVKNAELQAVNYNWWTFAKINLCNIIEFFSVISSCMSVRIIWLHSFFIQNKSVAYFFCGEGHSCLRVSISKFIRRPVDQA